MEQSIHVLFEFPITRPESPCGTKPKATQDFGGGGGGVVS